MNLIHRTQSFRRIFFASLASVSDRRPDCYQALKFVSCQFLRITNIPRLFKSYKPLNLLLMGFSSSNCVPKLQSLFGGVSTLFCVAVLFTTSPVRAEWVSARFSGPVLFDDPIAACVDQFTDIYTNSGFTPYEFVGSSFSGNTNGVPVLVSCDWAYRGSNKFFAPLLSSYGSLRCQTGFVASLDGENGCAPAGNPAGANNGVPDNAGRQVSGSTSAELCNGCNVGDPINVAVGNEFQRKVDYRSVSSFPLIFERFYNSDPTTVLSSIGAHWRHTYDRSITSVLRYGTTTRVSVFREDGKIARFSSVDGETWSPVNDRVSELRRIYGPLGTPVGWTFKTEDDEIENYDANGRLLSIINRLGLKQTLAYNAAGRLAKVSGTDGRSLTFHYDAQGRIDIVTAPANRTFHYIYDSAGNLRGVTYPDNTGALTYEYNEQAFTGGNNFPHALTGIIDGNGNRSVTVTYDSSARATSTYDGNGVNRFTIQYPVAGSQNIAQVTDPLGTVRSYTFVSSNGSFRVTGHSRTGSTKACGNCSSIQSAQYDANGFLSRSVDFNLNRTFYTANNRGLIESRTEAQGTAQARTTTTSWDPEFHLPLQINEPGRTTDYVRDPQNGNLLSETVTDTVTGISRTTRYSDYTVFGQPQVVDGPRTDISDITRYDFDSQGNLRKVTNALGHTTQFTQYDAHGNAEIIIDPNMVETRLTYDGLQRVRTRLVAGALTRYDYDLAGNLKTLTLPNIVQIIYGYDTANRLVSVSDNAGNRMAYTLDDLGNRVLEQTYDPNGVLRRTISRVVDPLTGWITNIRGANGQDTQLNYYGDGQIRTSSEVTSSRDFVTTNYYDALNRLSRVVDAKTGSTGTPTNETLFGYTPFGQLNLLKDPAGLDTTYAYNGLGDLTTTTSPDTGTTETGYDSAGNVRTKRDARLITATYAYDELNRIRSITYPNAAENVTYFYDGSNYGSSAPNAIGRVTGASDQSGVVTYYYGSRGTLQQEIKMEGSNSYTTSYTYDLADILTSIKYPSGDSVVYVLDALGQVSQVNATIAGSARVLARDIRYLPFGSWTSMTLGNGITNTRSFDLDYRINAVVSGTLINRNYAYEDQRNNITGITDNLQSRYSQIFEYDELRALTTASGDYGTLIHAYNGSSGDRSLLRRGISSTAYNYDPAAHRLLSAVAAASTTFTYDASGNEIQRSNRTRSYNNAGRLVSTSDQGSPQYLYNSTGQRVRKSVASGFGGNTITTTVFAYDQAGLVLREGRLSGQMTAEYFHLNGEPLALYTTPRIGLNPPAQLYYYHNDHLGTPQLLTDSVASSAWSAVYSPFGSANIGTQRVINNLRLPGQYYDDETGLNQNWYRDYDPVIGRYIESDPIGLLGGINTYAYGLNNPISNTDPTGKSALIGALPAAGFAAAADGPFPVGDAIGLAILAGAAIFDACSENDETERCAEVRRKCIAQCSTVPPLDQPGLRGRTNQGIPFFNCVNRCLEDNNCP